MSKFARITALVLAFSAAAPAFADKVNVAVAANFTAAMNEIAPLFTEATGHEAVVSFGSTGKLYTQIQNGAPFGVFLAADAKRPALAEKDGLGVTGTRFTYALGRLALWSKDPALVDDRGEVLKGGKFTHLAIANPKTAPYGAAAVEVIAKLGLDQALEPKLVRGDNIAQTYQFVATGNAELGFVALAQIALLDGAERGSAWRVPQELYAPIEQQAVLLKRDEGNPAAKAFLEFLRGPEASAVIERFGYGLM